MRIARIALLTFTLLTLSLSFVPQAQAINIWKGASCGGDPIGNDGGPIGACNFCDAIIVGNNIITFLFEIAIPIAVGMLVWGGVKMMFARGSSDKIDESKRVMLDAFYGLLIILASWIVVNAFLLFVARGITGTSGTWSWNIIRCQ